MERLTNNGGDPVVQLQTNFGGGKTHSMLALFHLFSGAKANELPGIEEVMQETKVTSLPKAHRAVLVGNKISPSNPTTKPDGTVVRTLWVEMAWQLGGKQAYELIRKDDENATIRKFLAWQSILAEKDTLDLRPHQVKQAETLLKSADSAVADRLPETYQWLLAPVQITPQSPMTWDVLKLTGQLPLAERASKKLRSEELLLTVLGANRLRMELDKVPLWRGDHVDVSLLVEDFAQCVYLPRLTSSTVLLESIRNGVNLLTWTHDGFAFAESYDDVAKRYKGWLPARCSASPTRIRRARR